MNRRHRQDLEIQSSLIAFLNPDLCRPASDLIEVGGIKPFALIDLVDSHDKICSNGASLAERAVDILLADE